jgi:hypothetical protein
MVESLNLAGDGFKNLFIDTEAGSAVELCSSVGSLLYLVDRYLWGHPRLLEKRLIFFKTDDNSKDYVGFCAITPWVQLVKCARHQKKRCPAKEVTGKKGAGPAVTTFLSDLIYNVTSGNAVDISAALPLFLSLTLQVATEICAYTTKISFSTLRRW